VHSGISVPVVPRGGSPIFSTSTSPGNGADPPAHSVKKTKGQVVVKNKHGQSLVSHTDKAKHPAIKLAAKHPQGPAAKKHK
jgi:hypothetical protein